MPIAGNPEGEPAQTIQQQVDQDHADTRRPAGAQCEYQQEQVAVAQPPLSAAGSGRCRAGPFYPWRRSDSGDLRGAQSSDVQVAGGPPEHSRPAQHCSLDVQVSPSSVHSAALGFGIKPIPNGRSRSDNWLLGAKWAAFGVGCTVVGSFAEADCEKA